MSVKEVVAAALELLGKGMLALFISILLIFLVVKLLTYCNKKFGGKHYVLAMKNSIKSKLKKDKKSADDVIEK